MPNRGQTQDQQQVRRNPTQTSPDDDEAQVGDQSPAEMEEAGAHGGAALNQERVTQVEDEEAEDDEDEADGIGPRP